MLSVGGFGGSLFFSSGLASDANRTAFVNAVLNLTQTYDLDGLDFELVSCIFPLQHLLTAALHVCVVGNSLMLMALGVILVARTMLATSSHSCRHCVRSQPVRTSRSPPRQILCLGSGPMATPSRMSLRSRTFSILSVGRKLPSLLCLSSNTSE